MSSRARRQSSSVLMSSSWRRGASLGNRKQQVRNQDPGFGKHHRQHEPDLQRGRTDRFRAPGSTAGADPICDILCHGRLRIDHARIGLAWILFELEASARAKPLPAHLLTDVAGAWDRSATAPVVGSRLRGQARLTSAAYGSRASSYAGLIGKTGAARVGEVTRAGKNYAQRCARPASIVSTRVTRS